MVIVSYSNSFETYHFQFVEETSLSQPLKMRNFKFPSNQKGRKGRKLPTFGAGSSSDESSESAAGFALAAALSFGLYLASFRRGWSRGKVRVARFEKAAHGFSSCFETLVWFSRIL